MNQCSMSVLLRRGAWGLPLERFLPLILCSLMMVELLENTTKIVEKGDFVEVPKRRWNLEEGCMGVAPFGGGTSLYGRGTAEHSKMM